MDSAAAIPEARRRAAGVPPGLSNGTSPVDGLSFEEARRSGALREVEIAWTDHQGQLLGKRLPSSYFSDGRRRSGFCSAALAWDHRGEILAGTSLTGPDSSYPDAFLAPDLETFRWLPWREGVGQILCDVVDRDGQLLSVAPRSVLLLAGQREPLRAVHERACGRAAGHSRVRVSQRGAGAGAVRDQPREPGPATGRGRRRPAALRRP